MQKRRESSERRGRRRLYGVVFLRLPYKSCRTSHAPSSFCQPVFSLLFSTLKFKSSSPSSGSPLEPPPHSAAYNESWIRASSGMPVVEGRPNMLYCMLSSVYCFRSAWWWYLIPPFMLKGEAISSPHLTDYSLLTWNKWQKENPFHFLHCAAAHTVLLSCRLAHCAASPQPVVTFNLLWPALKQKWLAVWKSRDTRVAPLPSGWRSTSWRAAVTLAEVLELTTCHTLGSITVRWMLSWWHFCVVICAQIAPVHHTHCNSLAPRCVCLLSAFRCQQERCLQPLITNHSHCAEETSDSLQGAELIWFVSSLKGAKTKFST